MSVASYPFFYYVYEIFRQVFAAMTKDKKYMDVNNNLAHAVLTYSPRGYNFVNIPSWRSRNWLRVGNLTP